MVRVNSRPFCFYLFLQCFLLSLEYNTVSFLGWLSLRGLTPAYLPASHSILPFPPHTPSTLGSFFSLIPKACPLQGHYTDIFSPWTTVSPALSPTDSSFGLRGTYWLLRGLSWPPSFPPHAHLLLHYVVIFSLQLLSKIIFICLFSVYLFHLHVSSVTAKDPVSCYDRISALTHDWWHERQGCHLVFRCVDVWHQQYLLKKSMSLNKVKFLQPATTKTELTKGA